MPKQNYALIVPFSNSQAPRKELTLITSTLLDSILQDLGGRVKKKRVMYDLASFCGPPTYPIKFAHFLPADSPYPPIRPIETNLTSFK